MIMMVLAVLAFVCILYHIIVEAKFVINGVSVAVLLLTIIALLQYAKGLGNLHLL